MAMGTRKRRERQEELWIATAEICATSSHPFYVRLNELLDKNQFDPFVEGLCRGFYKDSKYGRPSMTPGTYFRCMLLGYFEGIDSERGIAWRVEDSLSLRNFLGFHWDKETPDHSTLSRTR